MREQVKDMRNLTRKLLHKVTQRCTYGEEESSVTVLRTQSQQRAPHEENAARKIQMIVMCLEAVDGDHEISFK